jgi:hypothetical protein
MSLARPRTFTSVEISVMLNALFEKASSYLKGGAKGNPLHLKQNQLLELLLQVMKINTVCS